MGRAAFIGGDAAFHLRRADVCVLILRRGGVAIVVAVRGPPPLAPSDPGSCHWSCSGSSWRVGRLTRRSGRRRVGALLVAACIGVGLPAAALTVNAASQHIEVASAHKPFDNPVWDVRCDSAFQTHPVGNDLSWDFTAACSRATRPWRWSAGAILLASMALLVGGIVQLTKRTGPRPARRSATNEMATPNPVSGA